MRVGAHLDRVDDELAVDGDADPHVVHRLAGRPHAGQQLEVVVLGVDEVRLDVEQAVVAPEAFVGDAALVQALARDRARRKRHRVEGGT